MTFISANEPSKKECLQTPKNFEPERRGDRSEEHFLAGETALFLPAVIRECTHVTIVHPRKKK
jgi:hypothetical protein